MSKPRHDPEIIRAKVAEAIEELRDGLRRMGWAEDEIGALTRTVEQRALRYAATPDVDELSG